MEIGKYFLIKHLQLMTGLSDRTIRNHISSGLLRGEMINGVWHFTPAQVDEFIRHPAVRPGIRAKHNSIVYDFLADEKKMKPAGCIIIDIPDANAKATADFFCSRISEGDYTDISFAFEEIGAAARLILSGEIEAVLALVNEYCLGQ